MVFEKKVMREADDPVGLPDWTLPVSVVAQVVENLKVDIVSQSLGNLKVDIAAQSLEALDINIVSSQVTLNVCITSSQVTLDVNIASSQAILNVNITSSQATLNVSIQAQVVDIKVVSPSGKAVNAADTLATSSVVDNVEVREGQEVTLLSITGRCRLSSIGIRVAGATSTTRAESTTIKVYVDGSLRVELDMHDLDRLNGFAILEKVAATSSKYFADVANPQGALTAVLTCSDYYTHYQRCGGFINLNAEASSSMVVKAYQPSGVGNVVVNIVAIYGGYV